MVTVAGSTGVHGIVLAGVHAWGESILEEICCRPLLPVLGRPLVWHVLDWLSRNGIARASICANSDTGIFKDRLGTGTVASVGVDYYADLMPRGPAGCVRDAAYGPSAFAANTFVVVDGTVVTRMDLAALLAAHEQTGAAITMVVEENPGAPAVEPAGIYVISRAALDYVPSQGYQDIKEMLIPKLYEAGQRVVPYVAATGSLRVTNAASYLSVLSWALQDPPRLPGTYNRIGQSLVHVTSFLARNARLIGRVIVAPHCVIEQGATVLGPTVIAPDVRIGRDAVVSRTSIWPRCVVGRSAVVDHSILTCGSRIEAATGMRDTVYRPRHGAPEPLPSSELYWGLAAASAEVASLRAAELLPLASFMPRPPSTRTAVSRA